MEPEPAFINFRLSIALFQNFQAIFSAKAADPNSFRVYNADFSYDKDHIFENGIMLSASEVLIRNLYNIKTKNGG